MAHTAAVCTAVATTCPPPTPNPYPPPRRRPGRAGRREPRDARPDDSEVSKVISLFTEGYPSDRCGRARGTQSLPLVPFRRFPRRRRAASRLSPLAAVVARATARTHADPPRDAHTTHTQPNTTAARTITNTAGIMLCPRIRRSHQPLRIPEFCQAVPLPVRIAEACRQRTPRTPHRHARTIARPGHPLRQERPGRTRQAPAAATERDQPSRPTAATSISAAPGTRPACPRAGTISPPPATAPSLRPTGPGCRRCGGRSGRRSR